DGEPELALQGGPAASLAGEAVPIVASGNQRVGRRVPDRIVDAVQDASQAVGAQAEDAVEAGAERRRLDLLGIAGTHGRDRVREEESRLQVADVAVELEAVRDEVARVEVQEMPGRARESS